MNPSRRDLSYSASAVFFTWPNFVANIRYPPDSKSFVATSAWMVSSGASGSRLTTGVPRAVRSFIGTSCARSRKTRPLFENRSRCASVVVCTAMLIRSSSLTSRSLHSPAAAALRPERVRRNGLYIARPGSS